MGSPRFICPILLAVFFVVLCSSAVFVGAYDPLDPHGDIKINWDIVSWTPDGYVAMVTMINTQMYRHISSPGWTLGWTWASNEVIWSVVGAQATDQGNCSRFQNSTPHSCMKNPYIIDLLHGAPYNQQVTSCCKGGILTSWGQDPAAAVSAFQVSVGNAGNTDSTVGMPENFTLFAPGLGYTCSPAAIVPSTSSLTPDGRRKTRAMNDIGMFYGVKHHQNEILLEAGSDGNVHSELIFEKDMKIFTLNQGWTFPRKVYFNGDECMMPLPDSYPELPNSAYRHLYIAIPKLVILVLIVLLALRILF